MARPIVAVSSVVVGCLAFVVAAHFYAEPDAPPGVAEVRRPPVSPRSAPAVPDVIRLPPQVIRAAPRPRRIAARARRPVAPAAHPVARARGWPCSPWRALGPVYSVHEGEKPRQRHVRSLCFGPRPHAQLAER